MAFRESFIHLGVPVEAFVHSFETIQPFFESDRERGRPSLQRMIADSWTIEDHPHLASIRKEAAQQDPSLGRIRNKSARVIFK